MRGHAVGDTVKVTVNRDGKTEDLNVKLVADTDFASGASDSQQQQQQQQQNQSPNGGYGNGFGGGQSPNGGYTDEELQELLQLLEMYGR